jgi:hypothetical protein
MYSPIVRGIVWLEQQPRWRFRLLMTVLLLMLAATVTVLGVVMGRLDQ